MTYRYLINTTREPIKGWQFSIIPIIESIKKERGFKGKICIATLSSTIYEIVSDTELSQEIIEDILSAFLSLTV
jgi:hypothetical protein